MEENNSGANDPKLYAELEIEYRKELDSWIKSRFVAAKNIFSGRLSSTSYGLKHEFESDTGIYISNGAFKGAMQAAGFEPVRAEERNWRFRVKLSEAREKVEKEIKRAERKGRLI